MDDHKTSVNENEMWSRTAGSGTAGWSQEVSGSCTAADQEQVIIISTKSIYKSRLALTAKWAAEQ